MLVFIDDSGDAGFKFEKGSSRYFVIACVIFDKDSAAEEASQVIKEYRQSLGWRDDHEFKFNKLNKTYKQGLIGKVNSLNFRVRAIVVDKERIMSRELKTNKQSFYNFTIKEVLLNNHGTIANAKLRLDGHEDRAYKKAALTYFRQELANKKTILKNAKFVDSKKDNLIQLADIVAGSIYRKQQVDKTDKDIYLELLEPRIEDIWYFK